MQKICAIGMIEYVEEKWTRKEEERKVEKVEKDPDEQKSISSFHED